MKTIFVAAGNRREFDHFIVELREQVKELTYRRGLNEAIDNKGTRWIYLSDPHQLRGLNDFEVQYYGTWTNRKDISEIQDEERQRRLK